jgi:hypothetical protein
VRFAYKFSRNTSGKVHFSHGVVTEVKFPMCLTKPPRHKDVLESGSVAPHVLNPALDGGEWLESTPGRFTPGGRSSVLHWLGGFAGPRTVPGMVAKKKKKSCPNRESNPGRRLIWSRYSHLNTILGVPFSVVWKPIIGTDTTLHKYTFSIPENTIGEDRRYNERKQIISLVFP